MGCEFFKGYPGLFLGSIAEAPLPTRWVFLACLSLSDMEGNFVSTIEGIARYANVSAEEARSAMEELQAPDSQSTTPDEEGRRVMSTGVNKWCVVNKRAYSDRSRSAERTEYLREKKRESRARIEAASTDVNKCQQVNHKRERERREEDTPPTPSRGLGKASPLVSEVVKHLNEKAGRTLKAEAHAEFISPRIKEGCSVEDMKLVIDHKAAYWRGTEQEEFLRPQTLFAPSHWDDYLERAKAWDKAGRPPKPAKNGKPPTAAIPSLAEARKLVSGNG